LAVIPKPKAHKQLRLRGATEIVARDEAVNGVDQRLGEFILRVEARSAERQKQRCFLLTTSLST
jgi:hypothetical protein